MAQDLSWARTAISHAAGLVFLAALQDPLQSYYTGRLFNAFKRIARQARAGARRITCTVCESASSSARLAAPLLQPATCGSKDGTAPRARRVPNEQLANAVEETCVAGSLRYARLPRATRLHGRRVREDAPIGTKSP